MRRHRAYMWSLAFARKHPNTRIKPRPTLNLGDITWYLWRRFAHLSTAFFRFRSSALCRLTCKRPRTKHGPLERVTRRNTLWNGTVLLFFCCISHSPLLFGAFASGKDGLELCRSGVRNTCKPFEMLSPCSRAVMRAVHPIPHSSHPT